MAEDLDVILGRLIFEMGANAGKCLLCCWLHTWSVNDGTGVLDLFKEDAMADECLTLILLKWEETEDTAKVSLCDTTITHVLVGDLGESAHCILGDLHVLRAECLFTHRDALNQSHSLAQEWLEGLCGQSIGKGTHAVGNCVLDEIALDEFLVVGSLEELLDELCHVGSIVANARVVDDVAPEAEHVKELLFGQLSVALELGGPVGLGARLNAGESLVLEFLNELAGQLHDLGGDTSDLGHLILDFFEVFFIDIVGGLSLLDQCAMGTLQRCDQVKRLFNDWSECVDLLLSQEL